MGKQSKNLSLAPAVVERAERFSELHRTSVSQLVSNFLETLPLPEDLEVADLTPTVARLFGIAKPSADPVADYHRHLVEKYGS